MDIKLRAKVMFQLPLTEEHVNALIKFSEHHYDAKCQMASDSIRGFLLGWKNIIFYHQPADDTDICFIEADFGQLDTCLKLIEVARLCVVNKIITKEVWANMETLARDIRGALTMANGKYHEWTDLYKGKTYA